MSSKIPFLMISLFFSTVLLDLRDCKQSIGKSDCYFTFVISSRGLPKMLYCFSLADRKKILKLTGMSLEVASKVFLKDENQI